MQIADTNIGAREMNGATSVQADGLGTDKERTSDVQELRQGERCRFSSVAALEQELRSKQNVSEPSFDTLSKLQYWAGHMYLVHRGKPVEGDVGTYAPGLATSLVEGALRRMNRRVERFRRRVEDYTPVPEIDTSEISDNQIWELTKYQKPFVVRGKLLDWPATREFTPEFFMSRYGDVKIPINKGKKQASNDLTKPTDYREYYKIRYDTVKNLVESVLSDGDLQALSVEDLLHRDDDYLIKNYLNLDQVHRWSGWNREGKTRLEKKLRVGLVGSLQLFMASTRGYTTWHCAPAHNFFLQLSGSKYWTFVDTAYTVGMSPVIKHSQQYQGSRIDARESFEVSARRGFKLYPYLPKQDVTLSPGDLLFNPQYCWHSVRTAGTEPTIGVGIRTVAQLNWRSPAFQTLRLLDWESYRIIKASANQGRLKDDDLVNRIFEYIDPGNRLSSDVDGS